MKTKAVAYFRTSSMTNVPGDSVERQREAVQRFAKAKGYEIVGEYFDAGVSGADPIEGRPGFADMLAHLESNGVKAVLVENATRFARDLAVQIAGHDLMKARGYALIPVDAPDYFSDETPTAVMVRQILGAVSEFEKASLVHKLRGARERKRAATGKCEGRKSHAENNPATVALAKKLRRMNPKTHRRMSLRKVADKLARQGHLSVAGTKYSASAVKSMTG
jgi:DNA invertase Pin-like site-specific DNA recombinase